MRLTLAITTYERPEALRAVLESVRRQRTPPDEILVADDGSGAATREVIELFIATSPVPARHVFQPHDGFRLTRLRNLAIAASTGDYLVFVDGDMLLHPDFVADHARLARPGFFTQGVRVLADRTLTRELLLEPTRFPSAWTSGTGGLRRAYLLHAPFPGKALAMLANIFIAIKGCNQGYWREDLERVNGFNEDIVGWGPEDKELAARLAHAGIRRQTLLFGGIACHLHHPPASRTGLSASRAVLDATRRERKIRCERGLDAHSRAIG